MAKQYVDESAIPIPWGHKVPWKSRSAYMADVNKRSKPSSLHGEDTRRVFNHAYAQFIAPRHNFLRW